MKWLISVVAGGIAYYICDLFCSNTYTGGYICATVTLAVIIFARNIYEIFDNSTNLFDVPQIQHLEEKEQKEYKATIARLEEEKKNLQSDLNVANEKVKHYDDKIAFEQKKYAELNRNFVKLEHERDKIWKDFQEWRSSKINIEQ